MSLHLDTRQRAMLREMGVHVWLPAEQVPVANDTPLPAGQVDAIESEAIRAIATRSIGQNGLEDAGAAEAHSEPQSAARLSVPPGPDLPTDTTDATPAPEPVRKTGKGVVRAAGPSAVTALPEGIAVMDWPHLADAVAHCQACAMCLGRRAPVLAAPNEPAPCDWLVVGDPPDEAQERLGLPFVDDAGVLLNNMLRAVGVRRFVSGAASNVEPAQRAYLTHVLKCRPGLVRAPNATELTTCANYLRREIALTQPKVILAMGRFAMQLLLSETPPESAKLPLGKLRGQVWRFAGVPVVVTYPPSYLLRSGQDKGKAWADMCLALDVAQGKLPGI